MGGGLSLRVSGLSDRTRRVFFFDKYSRECEKSRESEETGGETLTCGETFGVICLIFCAAMADSA